MPKLARNTEDRPEFDHKLNWDCDYTAFGTKVTGGSSTVAYDSTENAVKCTPVGSGVRAMILLGPAIKMSDLTTDYDELHIKVDMMSSASPASCAFGLINAGVTRLLWISHNGTGGKRDIWSMGASGNQNQNANTVATAATWYTNELVINVDTRKIDIYVDGSSTADGTMTPTAGNFPSGDVLFPMVHHYGNTGVYSHYKDFSVWVE